MNKGFIKLGFAAAIGGTLLSLSACESMRYYAQAAKGHTQMMLKRQPIDEVVSAAETDEETREKLALVERARTFAIETLKLPDNGSYTQYADIGRPYVVWNVVATEAYHTQPIKHCFPVAGCVSYRGYFNQADALAHADKLNAQGYDTIVSGAAAYSTLGWFSDPVLNTMLRRSDLALAGLIFHELAHQRVYQAGDTAFNESFATAVELAGVKAWAAQQDNDQVSQAALDQYQRAKAINSEVVKLILTHRQRISQAYQSVAPSDTEQLANIKQQGFDALRADYQMLRANGGGSTGYDRWFAGPLNNASLVLFGDYHGWLDAFETLLTQSAGDWALFYQQVEAMTDLSHEERQAKLAALAAEARQ